MLRWTLITVLMTAFAISAGCQNTAPPGARTETVSAAAYPRVLAQGNLDRFLAYDKPRVDRTDSGAMSVTVPVRILRDRDVDTQYRFIFFDERDQPLRPQMDWQYQTLAGRTQAFLRGSSLDPDAADWRLEIRPAR